MSYLAQILSMTKAMNLNCEYWDVRLEDSFETTITIVDGEIVTCTSSPSLGAFLRIKKDGFWLYESTTEVDQIKESLENLCKQPVPKKSNLGYQPKKQEPFIKISSVLTKFSSVPLSKKTDLLKNYSEILQQNKKISSMTIRYGDIYKIKSFVNSVGTQFEFDFNQGGVNIGYTLKDGGQLFDDKFLIYGSEFTALLNHDARLKSALYESEKFLHAPAIEPGKYRVLLDPVVTGVFTHESFGHKSEADFLLGNAQALAEWQLGSKIASENLTIIDSGQHVNTSGYCPVDDDGVPAQKSYLIKNGILTGRLHSIDTAIQLGESPTGNSRAMNFEWEPIVRMTSTYIEPGAESVNSILKRCEGVLLVEGVKHGSGLSTFTIAPTRGYIIDLNGEKKPVRLTVISGSVFDTLKNIEVVSSDFDLHSGAIGGCGKMEQWPLPVAHGGPYVLVKEMQVN